MDFTFWETTGNVLTIGIAVCAICLVVVVCVSVIVELFKIADEQIHKNIMDEISESITATKNLYRNLREADAKEKGDAGNEQA